jgi:outer membrane protein assembly factor BamE (lipoprotein component of BamABCDE complex)
VRTILGTPLLNNAFRPIKLDYLYEYKKQGRRSAISVYFVDDMLVAGKATRCRRRLPT